jgi:hypothetical protein
MPGVEERLVVVELVVGAHQLRRDVVQRRVGDHPGQSVIERLLLSVLGGDPKEAPHGADIALEWEIVRPRIGRPRPSGDDAFTLCDIDRVQLKARPSNVGRIGRHDAVV